MKKKKQKEIELRSLEKRMLDAAIDTMHEIAFQVSRSTCEAIAEDLEESARDIGNDAAEHGQGGKVDATVTFLRATADYLRSDDNNALEDSQAKHTEAT